MELTIGKVAFLMRVLFDQEPDKLLSNGLALLDWTRPTWPISSSISLDPVAQHSVEVQVFLRYIKLKRIFHLWTLVNAFISCFRNIIQSIDLFAQTIALQFFVVFVEVLILHRALLLLYLLHIHATGSCFTHPIWRVLEAQKLQIEGCQGFVHTDVLSRRQTSDSNNIKVQNLFERFDELASFYISSLVAIHVNVSICENREDCLGEFLSL